MPALFDRLENDTHPGVRAVLSHWLCGYVHPFPDGLEKIFAKFQRIVVVEMNDEGVYGYGQLATLLRARFCEPKIQSVTKTDGLSYRVREILGRVFEGKTFPSRHEARKSASNRAVSATKDPTTAAATERAEAQVSDARDRAGDNTPTMPGAEAADASSGTNETRPDAAMVPPKPPIGA